MILVIRISGLVEVPHDIKETLYRMRLRRKYTAVLIEPTPENMKLLNKVRSFVAYGPISHEMLVELIEKRGESLDPKKKVKADEVVGHLPKKKLESLGVKPFFRLHPPRGGIDSKVHYPLRKGALGDNKEDINNLLRRML